MKYRKAFSALLSLFLLLVAFLGCVLAEACFCGGACAHGLHAKTHVKTHIRFHHRCPDASCKSCNIENGHTLQTAGGPKQTAAAHGLTIQFLPTISHEPPSKAPFFEKYCAACTARTLSSPPIYIQNSSLIR